MNFFFFYVLTFLPNPNILFLEMDVNVRKHLKKVTRLMGPIMIWCETVKNFPNAADVLGEARIDSPALRCGDLWARVVLTTRHLLGHLAAPNPPPAAAPINLLQKVLHNIAAVYKVFGLDAAAPTAPHFGQIAPFAPAVNWGDRVFYFIACVDFLSVVGDNPYEASYADFRSSFCAAVPTPPPTNEVLHAFAIGEACVPRNLVNHKLRGLDQQLIANGIPKPWAAGAWQGAAVVGPLMMANAAAIAANLDPLPAFSTLRNALNNVAPFAPLPALAAPSPALLATPAAPHVVPALGAAPAFAQLKLRMVLALGYVLHHLVSSGGPNAWRGITLPFQNVDLSAWPTYHVGWAPI